MLRDRPILISVINYPRLLLCEAVGIPASLEGPKKILLFVFIQTQRRNIICKFKRHLHFSNTTILNL